MDVNKGLNPTIKLVLFDLDDTLVHTYANYELARQKVKEYFNSLGLSKDIVFKPILQKIRQSALEVAKSKPEQELIVKGALEKIDDVELKSVANSKLIDGTKACLSFLKNQEIKLGIFSRTCSKAVNEILKKFNLKGFAIILGRDDLKELKPSAEGILLALKKLKIRPSQTMVIGDHPYDIAAGKLSGTKTVGVLTGKANIDPLANAGADYILNSIAEFPELFRREFLK